MFENISLFNHELFAIQEICQEIQRYSLGTCLNNLMLYNKGTGQYLECDVIFIGYPGIYVVELKHWSGEIDITPLDSTHNWIRNGKYTRNPHIVNDQKAKILKGLYQHKFVTYPDVYFESVVILTNQNCKVRGTSSPQTAKRCPTFHLTRNFIKYVKKQTADKGKALSWQQIKSIRDYLVSIQEPRASVGWVIPNYEILEYLTQQNDLIEVVARPTVGQRKSLYRFRRYSAPFNVDQDTKARFFKRAYNTLNAVVQIGDHPNILKVWPVPDETGAVIEGSEWSEEGTLRDFIYKLNGDGVEEARALEVCFGILLGLHAAHAKGVIHRAVKPENILMVNGVPKLMNFDLSYQLASECTLTLIPCASVLKIDPYTAPEVYALLDVDDSTDLFSLGVIFFELLCGTVPFKSSRDLCKMGGRLPDEQLTKLAARGISRRIIDFIDRLVRLERAERFRSAEEALQFLGVSKAELEQAKIPPVANRHLDPGETHDVYEIKRLIGQGTEAQVYEAVKPRGQRVALKVFHKDIPMSRIQNEESNAGSVKSSYSANAKRLGHWKNDRYYIEMDLLEGRLMREDIVHGLRPNEETFIQLTSCLLEAVRILHERSIEGEKSPLIHGDIKPDNIMLRSDGTAVLFDFGCSGPPRVDTYQGTEGYVPPDLIQGADLQFCESGDLFALGVSLFEWAFGKRPFSKLYVGAQPEFPPDGKVSLGEPLIRWLVKSVQTSLEERFENASSMVAAFNESVAQCRGHLTVPLDKTPLETEPSIDSFLVPVDAELPGNPFVAYLNSLHNATECNANALAEAQALNHYFPHIHVPMDVTDIIYQQLSSPEPQHVILTGHAGDGKSTVALELFKRCRSIPDKEPLKEPMRETEEFYVDKNTVVLVKDLSELGEQKTSNLLEEALKTHGKRYLIISNTGALLKAFRTVCKLRKENWIDLQNRLLTAFEEEDFTTVEFAGASFHIINLARMDNVSLAPQIIDRMVASQFWKICENCSCRRDCPIHLNVRMLRQNIDVVRERIELVYRRLFEYGVRLTIRQITAHLAYALTGGLGHHEVKEMLSKVSKPPRRRYLFYNRFFGDAGEIDDKSANQLEAIRRIRTLEPGHGTHTELERLLWSEKESILPVKIEGLIEDDFTSLRMAGGKKITIDTLPTWAARMQVRRIIYLFGRFEKEEGERRFIATFLRSPMLWDFHRWQKTEGRVSPHQRKDLEQGILHVLQEHFTGVRLPEDDNNLHHIYITLSRRKQDIRQSAQIVLAKFPADNFEFHLEPSKSSIGNRRIQGKIIERVSKTELALDLAFLDYVKNRFQGELSQKLQSFFVDRLERFKVQLLKNQYQNHSGKMLLVRLQLDQRFRTVEIGVSDGKLEVV